jgi:hypothetical protein
VSGPFVRSGNQIKVRLSAAEVGLLRSLPALLAGEGDAGGRLDYVAYPDDAAAEERYRDVIGDDLDRLRSSDRIAFSETIGSRTISLEEGEAWMRVVGEARIAIAARVGITEDGWEEEAEVGDDPELALLGYLGFVQDALVGVLS